VSSSFSQWVLSILRLKPRMPGSFDIEPSDLAIELSCYPVYVEFVLPSIIRTVSKWKICVFHRGVSANSMYTAVVY